MIILISIVIMIVISFYVTICSEDEKNVSGRDTSTSNNNSDLTLDVGRMQLDGMKVDRGELSLREYM